MEQLIESRGRGHNKKPYLIMPTTYTPPPALKLRPTRIYDLPYYCRIGQYFFMITTDLKMIEVNTHKNDRGIVIQDVNHHIVHSAAASTEPEFMEAFATAKTAIEQQWFELKKGQVDRWIQEKTEKAFGEGQ